MWNMQNTEPERKRTGATLRALREAYGIRQGAFATTLEISHSYLANIEAGRKPLTPELARKAADALGVPLAALVLELEAV